MRPSSGVKKILTRQPPVQVVMVAGGSSLHHIRDETKHPKHAEKVCSNKICILLHHVRESSTCWSPVYQQSHNYHHVLPAPHTETQ